MRNVWRVTGTHAKLWLKTVTPQTPKRHPTIRLTVWSGRRTIRSEETLQGHHTWCLILRRNPVNVDIFSLLQAVIDAFIKDNMTLSLPVYFRRSVLREYMYKVQQGWDHKSKIYLKNTKQNVGCIKDSWNARKDAQIRSWCSLFMSFVTHFCCSAGSLDWTRFATSCVFVTLFGTLWKEKSWVCVSSSFSWDPVRGWWTLF